MMCADVFTRKRQTFFKWQKNQSIPFDKKKEFPKMANASFTITILGVKRVPEISQNMGLKRQVEEGFF